MLNQRQQQVIEFQNAQIETLLNRLGQSVSCSTTTGVGFWR
jgi:hypothetical protein